MTHLAAALGDMIDAKAGTITRASRLAPVNRGKLGRFLNGKGDMKVGELLRVVRALCPDADADRVLADALARHP
jgi:DNA-binding phage protein